MQKQLKIQKFILILLLLMAAVLAVARHGSFYEEREYYELNFREDTYDLMTGEDLEINQYFVAKAVELESVYVRFDIEDLVNLEGCVYVSVVDQSGDVICVRRKDLSSLTQTEYTKWTEFPLPCELEKGQIYTLRISTQNVSGDGSCKLYLASHKGFLYGDLTLNGTPSNYRTVATFKYNAYCLGDLWLMIALILFTAFIVLYSGRKRIRKFCTGQLNKIPLVHLTEDTALFGKMLLILSPFVADYIVQRLCGYSLSGFLEQLTLVSGLSNLLIYILITIAAYLITNRAKYASILTVCICYVLGLANYFVWNFRECPIVAADLASIRTAANVAANYKYTLELNGVWATVVLICYIALVCVCSTYKGMQLKRRVILLITEALLVTGVYGVIFKTDFMESQNITVSVWMPQRNYAQNGCALSFLLTCSYYVVDKPEGYSEEAVAELTKDYPSDEATDTAGTDSPNIIAIMNESFSDLAVDADIETSEDYMPFIHSLTENTVKGSLYVSVLGGNTANTEFEFQTGNSLAFFPSRSVPYNSYLRQVTGSLTWTLRNSGYQSIHAVHPYYSNGWSREIVYPLLGFTGFISQCDFDSPTYVREFISDESDFEMLEREYEEAKASSDEPFYDFSVTMQNHGGYSGTHGLIDETLEVTEPSNPDDQLTQYLNLIRESDDAFKELVEYFEQVDEPTIIVMFGDHQPGFTDSVYDDLMGQDTDTLDVADTAKMYQTPYIIWANYDIEEANLDMSANYLSSYLLNLAGQPLTGYNKYLLDLQKKVPVISAVCYIGDDGVVHQPSEDSQYSDLLNEYQMIQYNNMFDTDNRVDDFFFLEDADLTVSEIVKDDSP